MVETVGRGAGGERGARGGRPETKVRTDMAAFQADLPAGPIRASKWPGRGRHPPGLLYPALPGRARTAMGEDCFPRSLSITEPGRAQPPSQPSPAALRC